MSSLLSELRSKVLDNGAAQTRFGERVYLYVVPQKLRDATGTVANSYLPFAVLEIDNAEHSHSVEGFTGYVEADVTAYVYGATFDQCNAASEDFRRSLDAFRGELGEYDIQAVMFTTFNDQYFDDVFGGEKGVYSREFDIRVMYNIQHIDT